MFVLLRAPDRPGGRAVLIAPPFAEEMNKCRRLCTALAQALNHRGIAMVVPDLHGTGDSEGDFGEADWDCWTEDLCAAADHSARAGWPVAGLLGIRLGCQLAADFSRRRTAPLERTVYWQPVTDGARFLAQFLRLRVAARIMAADRESVPRLRERLAAEGSLDVAGYTLTAGLAREIDRRSVTDCLHANLGRLSVMEVLRSVPDAGATAVASQLLEHAAGVAIGTSHHRVAGEPFWSSTEIVDNPSLVELTAGQFAALAS